MHATQNKNNDKKKAVLFIDDEKMVLEVGSLMLQKLGYSVLAVSNGHKAIKILKGEEQVNGKTTIETLEADLKELEEKITILKNEITEKENIISQPNIKKGKKNFVQNRIDILKNEVRIISADRFLLSLI